MHEDKTSELLRKIFVWFCRKFEMVALPHLKDEFLPPQPEIQSFNTGQNLHGVFI